MTILDTIIAHKRIEIAAKKEVFPVSVLERSRYFSRKKNSLVDALRNSKTGIIAEYKRRSPSKSVINDKTSVQDVAKAYKDAGVSGMSVLTDTHFFGGSLNDLLVARMTTDLPLLRKDFIIDPYQIYEAKAHGADTILLIAACLSKEQLKEFSILAKSLDLEVLLEVHNKEELKKVLLPTVDMIGVNNRDLKTFHVSIETSKTLSFHIPEDFVSVSESGINSVETIVELRQYGYKGFLIGENFMKTTRPGESAKTFIQKLK